MEISAYKEFLKGPIDKLISTIGDELKQKFKNQLLEYQVYEYKRNYYSKTILHRAEPKKLDEFYQPLYIRKDSEPTKRIPTNSITKVFQKTKYLTLIGSAGSGKSTMVKFLFLSSLRENFKVPIKVELRYLNDFKGNIIDYIFDEIFKFRKIGFSDTLIDRLLMQDKFVFFFDGYDEINSNLKEKVTKNIDSFVKKYPNNFYLITSRPYTNIDLLPMFENYNVCNLSDGEIASFIKKQIPAEENEVAEKIIKSINKEENKSYKSFLSNPLLLSMFILTFQSYSDIPQKRSEFYCQVFDTLFSVHDSMSKLAFVREKQCGLTKEKFEEILRAFSFISFFEERFLFSGTYINDILSIIKNKKKNIEFDNEKIIQDLQVAIGILNKDGLDYTFPHRSLQEYFATSYIEKLSINNKQIIYKKLIDNLYNNFRSVLDKEHFFLILSEMDNNYMTLYFTLPILQNLINEIRTDQDVYKSGNYYHYYGVFLLTSLFLIDRRKYGNDYEKNMFIAKSKEYTLTWSSKNKKFNEPKVHEFGQDPMYMEKELESMRKQVKYLETSGENIINFIKNGIEQLNKSDEEIIDLI